MGQVPTIFIFKPAKITKKMQTSIRQLNDKLYLCALFSSLLFNLNSYL